MTFLIHNGRTTGEMSIDSLVKQKIECAAHGLQNAWYGSFSSWGMTNNNRNNTYAVRAVAAPEEEEREAEGWVEAYHDCRLRKRMKTEANLWRTDEESLLWSLMEDVRSREYTPMPSRRFIVTRPRVREIFAADFRDRIVHHWLRLRLEPMLEERFIETGDVNYNCRKGKGQAAAVRMLQSYIADGAQRGLWVAKMDIKAFFTTIDPNVVWRYLKAYIEERYTAEDKDTLLWLSELTLLHRPQLNCVNESPAHLEERLPRNKTMMGSELGLPIGNLPSQLLANYLMAEYDGWIKSRWPYVKMVRYCDDLALVGEKDDLMEIHARSGPWLRKNLSLTLHPDKWYLQPCGNGVTFVGCTIRPKRTIPGKRNVDALKKAMALLENARSRREMEHRGAQINSLMGCLSHHCTYRLRKRLVRGSNARGVTWTGYRKVRINNNYKP